MTAKPEMPPVISEASPQQLSEETAPLTVPALAELVPATQDNSADASYAPLSAELHNRSEPLASEIRRLLQEPPAAASATIEAQAQLQR